MLFACVGYSSTRYQSACYFDSTCFGGERTEERNVPVVPVYETPCIVEVCSCFLLVVCESETWCLPAFLPAFNPLRTNQEPMTSFLPLVRAYVGKVPVLQREAPGWNRVRRARPAGRLGVGCQGRPKQRQGQGQGQESREGGETTDMMLLFQVLPACDIGVRLA